MSRLKLLASLICLLNVLACAVNVWTLFLPGSTPGKVVSAAIALVCGYCAIYMFNEARHVE